VLGGQDLLATNSKQTPSRVAPRSSDRHTIDDDRLQIDLPPVSWTMLRTAPRP